MILTTVAGLALSSGNYSRIELFVCTTPYLWQRSVANLMRNISDRLDWRPRQDLILARLASIGALWVLAIAALVSKPCLGQYHPDHPNVQALVARGVAYLENMTVNPTNRGETMMVGYTIFKVMGVATHPKVQLGIQAALAKIDEVVRNPKPEQDAIVYEISVACILLSAVDPIAYRSQLETAHNWLMMVQKNNGGWGYLNKAQMGDTSQVQYAMLALWSLNQVGITTPAPRVEACLRFLQGTQDPNNGGWGYQAIPQVPLVSREGVTRSLGTAGICAVLLGGDMLKFFGGRTKDNDGIPKAFERIDNVIRGAEDTKATMKRDEIEPTISRAFRFQEGFGGQGQTWYYYWRYGQERYESLRELYDNKQQKSPRWYNEGVEEIARNQSADGSWHSLASTPGVDSSFAILFLIRSTQKSIGKLDAGLAFGGDGGNLPTDLTSIRMVGEKVVSQKDTSVENLLSLMEDEKNHVNEGLLPNNLALSKDPTERAQQVARLSRLLDSKNPIARRLAARLLGRSEDLRVVPELIYALSDPDGDVPKLAEEGLRLLSRRLSDVHVRQGASAEQKAAAARYWKDWYLTVRPDFVFPERS
jgi:hypothetical protein